jgi:hypothetical protein
MPTHDVWGDYEVPAGRRRTGDPLWDALLSPVWLTVIALASLAISVGLFVDLATGRQAVFEGHLIVVGGLAAVGLAYFALVAGLCQIPDRDQRQQVSAPRLAILLGGLALLASLALPLVEPAVGRQLHSNPTPPSCHENLRRVWTLVSRYRAETGHYPEAGPDFLRPVWERYRDREAEAFFCPLSYEYHRILEDGGDFASVAFEEISYEGGLLPPDTPRIPGDRVGLPLLWEKSLWHGAGAVQLYTSHLGVHSNSPQVLRRQLQRYREVTPLPSASRR